MTKERIIHYQIPSAYEGHKISEFLRNQEISTKSLIKLKSDVSNVCLNNEPGFINRILSKDDLLTIYVREQESSKKIPPVDLPLSIIYEDEDILVLNKPSNMPIHPSMNNGEFHRCSDRYPFPYTYNHGSSLHNKLHRGIWHPYSA